jgi:hypothetical protein
MFRRSEQQNRRISSNRSKTVNPLERRFLVLVGSVLLAMAVTACGDDPPPQDPITGGNNGDADATVSDAGDTSGDDAETDDVADDDGTTDDATDGANDGETEGDGGDTGDSSDTGDDGDTGTQTCETGDCDSGELCVEGSCVAETPQTKCQTADDIGVLPMNTQTTISDSLLDQSDILTTACGEPGPNFEGGERVYKFSVDEPAELDFNANWDGQFDGLLDFRTGDCPSGSTSSAQCFDSENETVALEPNTDYYLVVEHTVGRADDFTVTLEPSPLSCVPGTTTCENETLERCSGAGQGESFNCADTCSAPPSGSTTATACSGNACADAIEVVGAGTYVGDINAYSSEYDFSQIPGCEVGGTPVATPGAEVVFKISGAPAGTEFKIDAVTNDTNNNAIFVTSNCGNQASLTCVASYLSNEDPTWTVPNDNTDYFIFIDKTSNTGDIFHYQLSVVTNNQ